MRSARTPPRAISCASPTSRLSGDVDELADELARLPAGGTEAIPVVRSLQRRLLMLAPARARMERGERVDAVMTSLGKSLFWKDKAIVGRMLSQVERGRTGEGRGTRRQLERELMFSRRAASARRWARNCWRSRARRAAADA